MDRRMSARAQLNICTCNIYSLCLCRDVRTLFMHRQPNHNAHQPTCTFINVQTIVGGVVDDDDAMDDQNQANWCMSAKA